MAVSVLYMGVSLLLAWAIYIVAKCVHWYLRFLQIAKQVDKIPGQPKHWLYGTLHHHPGFTEKFLPWVVERVKEFPRLYRQWDGPLKVEVILTHPETAKEVLKGPEPKANSLGTGYNLIRPWLGDGLLISSGAKWTRNRKLLTPAFHFEILKPYVEIYNQAADKLLSKLDQQCTDDGQSVEVYQPISLCTMEVILKCAFSYKEDIQAQGEKHPYVSAVLELSKLIMARAMNPVVYFDTLYYFSSNGRKFNRLCTYAHQFADQIITKRKISLKEDPDQVQKRYLDFLDILLSARDSDGQGLSDIEIRQEVDTFLFEGHDTTASALAWTLFSLAEHPDIQDKVQQELDDLLKGRDQPILEWGDLSKLPYMHKCVKEALRLHSPVPMIGRTLTKPTQIDGYTFLPGTHIHIMPYNIHHNPTVWGDDHMEFKPERFDPELTKNMDPYAFVPFSSGPRNCIGQNFALNEEKVLLARILHRFTLSLDPEKPAFKKPEVVMRPINGIWLKLKPRH